MIKTFFLVIVFIVTFGDSSGQWNLQFQHTHPFSDILFINNDTGFVTIGMKGASSSGNGGLIRTTNGGINWEFQITGTDYLRNLCRGGDYLFAVGSSRVFISTDFGQSWSFTFVPSGFQTSAFFVDEQTGYVGGTQTLLKTTDGGFNWQNIFGTDHVGSIYFINSSTGVAYLDFFQRIVRTANSGVSWDTVYNSTALNSNFVNQIYFYNNTLWGVGEEFDDGTSKLIYSTDYGIQWSFDSSLKNISTNLHTIFFVDSNNRYVAGSSGGIFKSTNGGENWYSQYLPPTFIASKILFTSANEGYIIGRDAIYKTTNGGWDIPDFPAPMFPSNNTTISNVPVYFQWTPSYNNIFYTLQISTDSNFSTFYYNDSVYSERISLTDFATDTYYWRVRANGVVGNSVWSWVMKFIFNPTGITQLNSSIPGSFHIYQNYPNPFNPVTKIKFDIARDARREMLDVKLIVYDALGREVVKLVNDKLSAGSYEVEIDGSNFSSGIYFYKLETENFVETKRMVLLK